VARVDEDEHNPNHGGPASRRERARPAARVPRSRGDRFERRSPCVGPFQPAGAFTAARAHGCFQTEVAPPPLDLIAFVVTAGGDGLVQTDLGGIERWPDPLPRVVIRMTRLWGGNDQDRPTSLRFVILCCLDPHGGGREVEKPDSPDSSTQPLATNSERLGAPTLDGLCYQGEGRARCYVVGEPQNTSRPAGSADTR